MGPFRLSSQILGRRRLLDIRRFAARLVAFFGGVITVWAALAGLVSGALGTLSVYSFQVPQSALSDALFVSGVLVLVGVLMLFLSNTGASLVLIGGLLSVILGASHIVATGLIGQTVDIAGLVALGAGLVSTAVGTRRDLLQAGFPIHAIGGR